MTGASVGVDGAVPPPAIPPRRRRWGVFAAVAVCIAAIAWLVVANLLRNLDYLKPVSEAVASRAEDGTRRFRIGGVVVPGSIGESDGGARFELTEGNVTVAVELAGNPPELFDDCVPVVVEGRWAGTTFAGDRLLVRHGEEYDDERHELGDVADAPGCARVAGDAGDVPNAVNVRVAGAG